MTMPDLPDDWASTRDTLQAYAQALTALPRAAGTPDDRWGHVAMSIGSKGISTAPTPLADGTDLVGMMDLTTHEVIIVAGDDTERIDMKTGPSSQSVGDAMLAVASRHGSDIGADRDRFGTSAGLFYEANHAEAFLAAAKFAAAALEEMNTSIPGEVAGPHLWPHGFDIATEWYSPLLITGDDSTASAQIAVGFYPSNESYFYANPWPYEDRWGEQPPVEGSTWHLEGWQGAVLPPNDLSRADIVAFGSAVHDLARDSLS